MRFRRARGRRPGSYAERTHDSPYWIVRFPHRRRFERAIEMLRSLRPRVVLDYGAGDGYALIQLLADPRTDPGLRAVAYEPTDEFRRQIETRIAEAGVEDRVTVAATLDEVEALESPDFVFCAEVLEHLTLSERERFYGFCDRHLAPGGHVLIDVPIEHGISLLIKNFGRRVLKADAREYTFRETLAAGLGKRSFDPARFDPRRGDEFINRHKGFDHRLLASEVGARFEIVSKSATPFGHVPPLLGNQELLLLIRRPPNQ